MEFRILGPLEARTGETSLPLGGTKQRAVLAQLLLRAGEVVSAERLVDGLWAEPPETATKAVQVHISQLRKALAPNVTIHTRARGYVLEVAAEDLDLSRSELLRAEGLARAGRRRPRDRGLEAARCARALARAAAGGVRARAVRGDRGAAARGAPAHAARGADRGRSRSRPPRRARVGARGARRRASAPRAGARPAHAGALPLRPPGGRARVVSRGQAAARGGARDRAGPGIAAARALDPRPGSRARARSRRAAAGGACLPVSPAARSAGAAASSRSRCERR